MKKWTKLVFWATFLIVVAIAIVIGVYVRNIINENQVVLNLDKLNSLTNKVTIFDSNESVVSTENKNGTNTVCFEEIPEHTKNAFIAIEDNQFYKHNGLNYKRIIKAMLTNIYSGYAKEGASTITQQLVKNTQLTNEKTIRRKIKEAILALDLEKHHSKDEIMNAYLNIIYFGNNSYGLQEASQNYFGHDASTLNISESATLAGLIKSPVLYSPLENPKNCLKRRNLVLLKMKEQNYITENQYKSALKDNVEIVKKGNNNYCATFNKLAINEAKSLLNLSEKTLFSSGIKIYTTLDKSVQKELSSTLSKTSLKGNQHGSIIVVSPTDGKILGYYSTFNNPEIARSPASLIKPFLCYAPAFERNKLAPASQILDEKISFDGYSPQNVEDKYHGWISARFALANSLNIPAIKTLDYVGIDYAKNFASKFGINFTSNDNHLALALGSLDNGVTLKQIASAYSAFANLGEMPTTHFVEKITTKDGALLYQFKDATQKVCKNSTAFLINDILKDSAKTGTAKTLANLNINLSSKTGTNGTKYGKNMDAWNVSYNNDFCVAVWYGNVSSDPSFNLENNQNGGTIATKTAYKIWEELKKNHKFNETKQPKNVVKVNLDRDLISSEHKLFKATTKLEKATLTDYFSAEMAAKLKTSTPVNNPFKIDVQFDNLNNIVVSWIGESNIDYYIHIINNGKEIIKSVAGINTKLEYVVSNLKENSVVEVFVSSNNGQISQTKKLIVPQSTSEIKNPTKQIRKAWLNKSFI